MEKIVILGAGGFAREVLDVFMARNALAPQYEFLGFIDENADHWGLMLNGYPVLGEIEWFRTAAAVGVRTICGVGNTAVRLKLTRKAAALGVGFCSIVHPTAVITPFVEIGRGTIITASCTLTNQIRFGDHVHLNLDCTVGHDVVVDDFCTVAPGVHISGNVHIGTGCDIGTGAVILQGITIGEWSVVGAGAVVTTDLPANSTAVGIPARVIKQREPGWHELGR